MWKSLGYKFGKDYYRVVKRKFFIVYWFNNFYLVIYEWVVFNLEDGKEFWGVV